MITPKTKTLKSGLRIVVVPMPENKTVTVLTLVATGSKYESKKIAGLSHFLEHMCFKGTTKRPTAMDIAYELDSLGAESNAFTSQEYTGYYAKGSAAHALRFIDIVSDIYLHATFPEAEIEKEKGVIVEEINMYDDKPDYLADQRLMKLLYGDQPAGWPIAGDIKTVRSMKRKDFVTYHQKSYTAANTVIVVSGGVTPAIMRDIEKAFKPIKSGSKNTKKKVVERQKAVGVTVLKKNTQQTHLVFGFRGYDTYHDDEMKASLLGVVLGAGMSSRLFQKMREEMGICYYTYAEHQALTDHGIFRIAAGVTNARLGEATKAMLDECIRLKDELIPTAELAKAKDMIKGQTILSLESSNSWGVYYGGLAVLGKKLESIDSYLKKLDAITPEDLQKIARKLFVDKNMNVSAVGPDVEEVKIKDVVRRTLDGKNG